MRALGRGALGASAGCHAAAAALLLWSPFAREEPILYETVRVRLASPPPAPSPVVEQPEPAPPEEELVVETPEVAPPEEPLADVAEELPPEPEPEPEPEPAESEPPPPERSDIPPPPDSADADPEAEPAPPEASDEPDAEEGGEDVNVRQEGIQRDYPAYWNNLLLQMKRCFRPTRNLTAVVEFVVRRDGSTTDIDVAVSSGSFAFDLDAMGAAECIGRGGRLGPLPDDFPWDTVPVRIELTPPGRGGTT